MARPTQPAAEQQQRNPRQAGEDQDAQEPARHGQRLRPRKQLLEELARAGSLSWLLRVTSRPAASEIRNAGHLAHQAVADRQLGEQRGGLGRAPCRPRSRR